MTYHNLRCCLYSVEQLVSERKIKESEEVHSFPGANLQGEGKTQSPMKIRFSLGTRGSVFSQSKDCGGRILLDNKYSSYQKNKKNKIHIYIYISKIQFRVIRLTWLRRNHLNSSIWFLILLSIHSRFYRDWVRGSKIQVPDLVGKNSLKRILKYQNKVKDF